MKAFLTGILLSVAIAVPAFAGTAFIPEFGIGVNSEFETIRTDIYVSNISGVAQRVTITLIKNDGTPLANQPLQGRYAGGSPFNSNTSANGEFSFDLPAATSGVISLAPGVAWYDGHGRITGTVISGNGVGFLTATAFQSDTDATNTSLIFQKSITINGGNPF
jgi:hypothetical protein